MYSYLVILLALALVSSALPEASVYLQSQKGGENVHVHVKNFKVHVIVADESSSNNSQDDFDYDSEHFTLKPTASSTTTASTEEDYINLSLENTNSETTESSTATKNTSSSSADLSSTTVPTSSTESNVSSTTVATSSTKVPKPKCATGFVVDASGKCRKNIVA